VRHLRTALLLCPLLSGCAGIPAAVTLVGSTLAGGKAAYDVWTEADAAAVKILTGSCMAWEATNGAATAKLAAGTVAPEQVEPANSLIAYGEAMCVQVAAGHAPPSDPIENAVWLLSVKIKLDQATAGPAKATS
jgi:hypothetical protein